MTKCDTSKELDHLLLFVRQRSVQNTVCLLVNELCSEFELVWQIVEGEVLLVLVLVALVLLLGIGEGQLDLLLLYLLPILLTRLVKIKVAHDVEQFDRQFVISLECCSTEEHVRHFSKGQCGVRVDELNAGLLQVDVPLGEVCVGQHEQIDDVREA